MIALTAAFIALVLLVVVLWLDADDDERSAIWVLIKDEAQHLLRYVYATVILLTALLLPLVALHLFTLYGD